MKNEKIILGHNSFFGINHADYEKGKKTSDKFKNNFSKIIEILSYANEKKINSFMISTLDESETLIEEIKKTKLINNLNFYILLPYINKFVRKSNELGVVGVLQDQLSKGSIAKNLKYGLDISNFLIKFDFKKVISTLIDIELQPFHKVKKRIVILHDALTDILISLKRDDVILYFIDLVQNKYNCKAGFATKNFFHLNRFFKGFVQHTTILTHANILGFNMNPNKEIVEKEFLNTNYDLIFMSVLASGYLSHGPAFKYIDDLNISHKEMVIGCSSKKHIDQLADFCS